MTSKTTDNDSGGKIRARRWEFFTEFSPDAAQKADIFPGVDFTELIKEMKEDGIKHVAVNFIEIIDWDREPMRNFFHGVIVPAFQKALNEAASGESKPYYTLAEVKEDLKRTILGTVDGYHVISTEALTPEAYMEFLNACELIFFNKFNTMYDCKRKPCL